MFSLVNLRGFVVIAWGPSKRSEAVLCVLKPKLLKSQFLFHGSVFPASKISIPAGVKDVLIHQDGRPMSVDINQFGAWATDGGGPAVALPRHPSGQNRFHVWRRSLAGVECRRHGTSDHDPPGTRTVSQVFSRRQMDRIHR